VADRPGDNRGDPQTALEMLQRMAAIRDRLAEIDDEYPAACRELAEATTDHSRAYLTAHTTYRADNPKARVDDVENYAQLQAIDELQVLELAKARERFLKHEGHDLRSILSAFQTASRWFAEDAGHRPQSRPIPNQETYR
jgi:signal transduction histidine kinase